MFFKNLKYSYNGNFKNLKIHVCTFLFVFFYSYILSAKTVYFSNDQLKVDEKNKIILIFSKKTITSNDGLIYLKIKSSNTKFAVHTNRLSIGKCYNAKGFKNGHYKLFVTEIPIVSISTLDKSAIKDSLRSKAKMDLYFDTDSLCSFFIDIQIRGLYSRTLVKKSFEFDILNDSITSNKAKKKLLNLNKEKSWNLLAMYHEPLRFSNKSNQELWSKIHTPYYIDKEKNAKSGIQMEYVELFVNDSYFGIYTLSEKITRSLLKLKKYKNKIRGELYKGKDWDGAERFASCPSYNNELFTWSGIEYKYPKKEINWKNLYEFVHFVIYSDDETFYLNHKKYVQIDNAIDYFIFINYIYALDNSGKNIFTAKYKEDEPYFFVPWDLDGSLGIKGNGLPEDIRGGIISNRLFERLWKDKSKNGFREKLKERWNELKKSILLEDSVMKIYRDNYHYLVNNGVYTREKIVWTEYNFDENELTRISSFIHERTSYLDLMFNNAQINDISSYFPATEKKRVFPFYSIIVVFVLILSFVLWKKKGT
jgi:hypothetical protein